MAPPQIHPFSLKNFVFNKVVWMSCATAPVDTAQVPRLAEKYTATEQTTL